MARIFITGSSDGLGLLAGRQLVAEGHEVVLHARDDARAADTRARLPGCGAVITGDASTRSGIRAVAAAVNALGGFDAIIHNVGTGYHDACRHETADGLSRTFAVNVLAPYMLTALIARPRRLIYLSSGLHNGGNADLADAQWEKRPWNAIQAYSDTKLHDMILMLAVARRWPDVLANAVDPGWVPTRMGGAEAPGDLALGANTQAWLAVSDDPQARTTGRYFHHRQLRPIAAAARDPAVQQELLAYLEQISGVSLD